VRARAAQRGARDAARGAALREVEEHEGALGPRSSRRTCCCGGRPRRQRRAGEAAAANGRGNGCGCGHEEAASTPPSGAPPAALRPAGGREPGQRARTGGGRRRCGLRYWSPRAKASPRRLAPPPPPTPPPLPPASAPAAAARRPPPVVPGRPTASSSTACVKGAPPSDAVRPAFQPRLLLRLRVDEAAGGPGAPAPPLPYELARALVFGARGPRRAPAGPATAEEAAGLPGAAASRCCAPSSR